MELGLGVSAYNCQELREAGCPDVVEVPILLDLELLETPPDKKVLSRFAAGGPKVLHVGRVAPNKRLEDLVKTHYWLTRLLAGGPAFAGGQRRPPHPLRRRPAQPGGGDEGARACTSPAM